MAQLRLGRFELERNALPEVCMRCGEPATGRVRRQFSWRSQELILFGLLLNALLNPMKRMTIDVPLCGSHQNLWSRRATFNLAGLLILVGGLALLALLERDSAAIVLIGLFFLAIVWLIVNIAFEMSEIRATEITDKAITLKGVSEEFITELHKLRGGLPPEPNFRL